MKFKNFFTIISIAMIMAIVVPVQSFATVTEPLETVTTDPDKNAEMLARITQRVNEIQNMDKTNLTGDEKRVLRKELKGMYKQVHDLNDRVYITVGGLIIIILLLILILR